MLQDHAFFSFLKEKTYVQLCLKKFVKQFGYC